MTLGVLLGLTAAVATLIQISLSERLKGFGMSMGEDLNAPLLGTAEILRLACLSGLAGSVCGAIVGFAVPAAYKANLLVPERRLERKELRDLLGRAERVFGTKVAAENWMFTPKEELDGITPSEAIHFKELATGVSRLLDNVAPGRPEERAQPDRSGGPIPILIQGGRVG
jgi:hypothetical protein